MKYIKETTHFNIEEPSAVSLGKFDGIHRGHEFLMEEVLKQKKNGLASVAFTFSLPTGLINYPDADLKVITTNDEKAHVFDKLGMDYLVECPMIPEIMRMEPEEFIKKLVQELHMKFVVVGTDFHFGHNRAGDFNTLKSLSDKYGYKVEVVEKLRDSGRDISSTRVREALQNGNIEEANRLLGYNYFIEGKVSHGNAIGRKMKLPTINIPIPENKQLPPFGVYATETVIGNNTFYGASNVGVKPTIPGENVVACETNLFSFDADIYEETVYTKFYKFIRPERKFESLDELKNQIEQDVKDCKHFFEIG